MDSMLLSGILMILNVRSHTRKVSRNYCLSTQLLSGDTAVSAFGVHELRQ
jgi:hypothetical protein